MKKDKIWNIINVAFIIFVFFGLLGYIFMVDGIENIVSILKHVNYWWLIAGIIFTVVYWFLEGLCFYVITKKIYKDQKLISSFRLAMIGRLFNNITPFSCGDQPAQLVAMNQEKKSLSDGASILLTRFIVYQAVLVIYTIVVMIFKYTYFASILNRYMYFAIFGFILNGLVIAFLLALVINEKLVFAIVKGVIKLLGDIKVVKKVDENIEKFKGIVSDFHKQIELIKNEKMMILKVAIYTAIEITVLYTITYIVYRAFGQTRVDYFTIISAQAFLSLVTVYMPTPGAGGVAEGGFYIMFKTFFNPKTLTISMVFWRFFTFYLPIIIGIIFLYKKPIITTDRIGKEDESNVSLNINEPNLSV